MVGLLEGGGEGFGLIGGDEVDGAAAEAAAGEAGAEAAGEGDGGVDEEVDFFAGCGEVVAVADVGGEHELSEGGGVAGEHGLAGGADAGVFGDDVAAAEESFGGDVRLDGFELGKGGVAEVAKSGVGAAEDGLAFFELAAPDAVLAGGDGVFDHGVADDDLGVGEGSLVHGQVLEGEVAGIDQQGVAGVGGGDDELVHDAAGGVDVVVFGALAEEGDFGWC